VIAAVKSKLFESLSSNPVSIDQFSRSVTWKGVNAKNSSKVMLGETERYEREETKRETEREREQ
jgi:hypothetical protein